MKKRLLIVLIILSLFFANNLNLEAKWIKREIDVINATSLKPDSEVLIPAINRSIEIFPLPSPKDRNFDVIIFGGTPGGIAAAIAAARHGLKTAIVEHWRYIGGMMTNGLSRTDIIKRGTVGGIFREFIDKIYNYYVDTYGRLSSQVSKSNHGLFFEPSVGELVFHNMILDEGERIQVFCSHQLISLEKEGNNISSVLVLDRERDKKFSLYGKIFVDATYEGDLAAMAGCSYRVGREGRDEYNERYAGTIYQKIPVPLINRILPRLHPILIPIEQIPEERRAELGQGDHRIMAYNFRFILTKDPANRASIDKPENYNRSEYLPLAEDVEKGIVTLFSKVFLDLPIPNRKCDVNNFNGINWMSSDLPEENYGYPTANWSTREKIIQRHRDYIIGMLYFLQNDPSLPETFREDALKYGFAKDEFTDNNYFPRQLYVREARRIIGEYVFRERDALPVPWKIRPPIFHDSIACGDYPIDSHACRKQESQEPFLYEGVTYIPVKPYMIPYRVILPKEVDNLLVPVACSATHVGFSTLRMEPVWMALGQAAGTAAYHAIDLRCEPRKVNVTILQDTLLNNKQVVCYFRNLPENSQKAAIIQKMGVKGLCPFYVFYPFLKYMLIYKNDC